MNALVLLAAVVLGSADARSDAKATSNADANATSNPNPNANPNANPNPNPTSNASFDPPGEPWLDRSHAFVSDHLLEAVGWFDDLFADGGQVEFERNGSTLLLRQELRLEDAPRVAPRTDLRLDLQLPRLGSRFERLHLVVYAQSVAQDLADRVASLRGGGPGTALGRQGDPAQGAAELRYDVVRALLAHVDVGGGVHVDLPPGAYLRTRARSTFGVAPRTVARLTESLFYDTFQRLGTASRGEVEHALAPGTLLHLDAVAAATATTRAWEWGGELSALRALGPSSAVALGAAILGHGRGGPTVDTYRISTRLRASAVRRWIAFEVEPEVAWPLDPLTAQRRRVLAASFRVEVQFGTGVPAAPMAPGGVPGMRDTP